MGGGREGTHAVGDEKDGDGDLKLIAVLWHAQLILQTEQTSVADVD